MRTKDLEDRMDHVDRGPRDRELDILHDYGQLARVLQLHVLLVGESQGHH